MFMSPTLLYPLTLVGLLHHILETQSGTATTTLVICSSRDTFLQQLFQSLQQVKRLEDTEDQDDQLQNLATPTLHNLLTTRHIKLAFCASVQTLLAYLTAFGRDASRDTIESGNGARMFLVNPLSLHASTLSFSAQGLSRSFAAATETALRSGIALHVVECQSGSKIPEQQGEDVDMSDADEPTPAEEDVEEDPWELEVSILNVSARRFGSNSGERAWAGRTVKAKRIAARWFQFKELHEEPMRQ